MTDSADFQEVKEYDSNLDSSNDALLKLEEYISNYPNGIILAGPPTLKGSLANFYKDNPKDGVIIKAFEHGENKVGIHSFVQKHKDVISFNGKGHQKCIVLANQFKTFRNTYNQESEPTVSQSRSSYTHRIRINDQINELRGTIRSIEVLLKMLSNQVENLK